jgi:hypothetical protein
LGSLACLLSLGAPGAGFVFVVVALPGLLRGRTCLLATLPSGRRFGLLLLGRIVPSSILFLRTRGLRLLRVRLLLFAGALVGLRLFCRLVRLIRRLARLAFGTCAICLGRACSVLTLRMAVLRISLGLVRLVVVSLGGRTCLLKFLSSVGAKVVIVQFLCHEASQSCLPLCAG